MQEISAWERSGLLILAVVLIVPQPLSTAVIVVDGGCSLGEAIQSANSDSAVGGCTAGSGTDTLELTDDVDISAPFGGNNGLPPVTSEIVVEGNGHTVARTGGENFRIFDNPSSGDLHLKNITITGGDVVQGLDDEGGGVRNRGTLLIEGSLITGNHAFDAGGGIFNQGTATVINSTLSNNSTFEDGGGIYSDFDATTTVIDSEITGNYSFWDGSGIFAYEGNYPDEGITITGSTISGNEHSGVVIFYGLSNNTLTITNSTISGNGNDGMYILGSFGGIVVENSTFVGNGGDNLDGYVFDNPAYFKNVISAYAGGADCSFDGFTDGGGNFGSDGSCGPNDITGLDPVLADNGGPTRTHALLAGSSAIDAGGDCGFAADQRGFGRDASCDSGAFEFDGAPPVEGLVGGLTSQNARCINLTSGDEVTMGPVTDWNCRTAGLAIDSGDRVRMTVRGRPSSPQFTGALEGLDAGRVLCQNQLTGQSVFFPLGSATDWNCRTEGLNFSADNTISWTVTGVSE